MIKKLFNSSLNDLFAKYAFPIFIISACIAVFEFFVYKEIDRYVEIKDLGYSELPPIMIFVSYLFIILAGLVLVFFSRQLAFRMALELSFRSAIEQKEKYLRKQPELMRIFGSDRERLAREVLAPMLLIMIKSPIVICGLWILFFYIGEPAFELILVGIVFFIVIIISSYLFRWLAKRLDNNLRGLNDSLHSFVKVFDYQARYINKEAPTPGANENVRVGKLEGLIDVVSQVPRQSLDVIIIFALLYLTQSDAGQFSSILAASPILLRSLSSFQQMYKAFASINANLQALSLVSSVDVSNGDKINPSVSDESFEILIKCHSSQKGAISNFDIEVSENLTINCLKKGDFRVLGISLPSGTGKTNATLNFLNKVNHLPSRIRLNISGCEVSQVGYISAEPYLSNEQIEQLATITDSVITDGDVDFIPKNTKPSNCSSGELFRWCFVREFFLGSKVIVVDESLANIDKKRRQAFLKGIRSSEKMLPPLIVITHSNEILSECDITITVKK